MDKTKLISIYFFIANLWKNHFPHFVGTPPRLNPPNYTFARNPREENLWVLAMVIIYIFYQICPQKKEAPMPLKI